MPEGRLSLDPAVVDLDANDHDDSAPSSAILVADLRDPSPGWELHVSMPSSDGAPRPAAVDVITTVEPIVGAACGVKSVSSVALVPGASPVVVAGEPVTGWGSYWVHVGVRAHSSELPSTTPAHVRLQFAVTDAAQG